MWFPCQIICKNTILSQSVMLKSKNICYSIIFPESDHEKITCKKYNAVLYL